MADDADEAATPLRTEETDEATTPLRQDTEADARCAQVRPASSSEFSVTSTAVTELRRQSFAALWITVTIRRP